MTRTRPLIAAALAAAAACGPHVARADDLCPPTATPADTMPTPDGWRAWRTDESTTYKLADVTFTDGPPELRTFLSPLATARRGNDRVVADDFTSSTLHDVWVVCQYRDTTIALVRQTDLRGKRCQASDAKTGQRLELRDIACK